MSKTSEHSFGDWTPDQDDQNKHYRECACGEKETADCSFDANGACTVCGREKTEESGIIIVIFSESLDNAYSAISVSNMGRATFFDDPTDETVYTVWDVAYRYEIEGEVQHENVESFEDEYNYYPAQYWVSDPQYSYPDGIINVTGINQSSGGLE